MEPFNPHLPMPGQNPGRQGKPQNPPGSEPAERLARPEGWLHFESGWLSVEQTLGNLETAISLYQTLSEGVDSIGNLTNEAIGQLHSAWSQGEKDRPPPAELERGLRRRLEQMDEIVRSTRFHGRGLINGQSGVEGKGDGVGFLRGGPRTTDSPPEGFQVKILATPTRAALIGGVPIHEEWIKAEREIFLAEGERFIRFSPKDVGNVSEFLQMLQEHTNAAGLDLEVGLTRQRRLVLRHYQYGSHFKFKGCSRLTPLLSKRPGKIEWSRKGRDIQGTLAGEPAFGLGRMLVGFLDNNFTSELAVMWRGMEPGRSTAQCLVRQNSIVFQDSPGNQPEPRRISIPSFATARMGRWVEGRSGYQSLFDARAYTWQEVADTLQMLFSISCEVDEWRERVRNWTQQTQNAALDYLRRELPGPLPSFSLDGRQQGLERMAEVMRDLIGTGGGRVQ